MEKDNIVTVCRFTSTYPENDPNSYVIGFKLSCPRNHRSLYKETRLLYKDLKTHGVSMDEDKIIDLAWKRLEPQCLNWFREAKDKKSIKGMRLNV